MKIIADHVKILAIIAGLLVCAGELPAQADVAAPEESGAGPETEPAADRELSPAEALERATDLREEITENIGMEMREAPEDAPDLEASVEPEGLEADTQDAEEEEPWWHRFNPITNALQDLPERVPGLAGKGWIHFGRLEGEYADFSSGSLSDSSGTNFRSLRGGIIREFKNDRTVKLEIDITDGDSNWVDLWGRFRTRAGLFTVGNQRVAQTLVNQTGRLSRTFMEVPLPAEAFGLGRRIGVGWDFHLYKVGAHVTAFGKDLNDNVGDFGYGARFYFNPAKTRFNMFHLGVSAVQEKMDRDARFRAHPETRVTSTRLVDTGRDADVDSQSIYGLEMAGAKDNWSVRAEYLVAQWDRISSADTEFNGYYVQANRVLTGESFKYSQGKFLRIRPQSTRGAWELAVRYSYLDLTDLDVQGGKERNATIGLNWYGPGNQFRAMLNLIFVNTDAVAGNQDPFIFQVRGQLHW